MAAPPTPFLVATIALLVAHSVHAASSAPWPMYRHDAGASNSASPLTPVLDAYCSTQVAPFATNIDSVFIPAHGVVLGWGSALTSPKTFYQLYNESSGSATQFALPHTVPIAVDSTGAMRLYTWQFVSEAPVTETATFNISAYSIVTQQLLWTYVLETAQWDPPNHTPIISYNSFADALDITNGTLGYKSWWTVRLDGVTGEQVWRIANNGSTPVQAGITSSGDVISTIFRASTKSNKILYGYSSYDGQTGNHKWSTSYLDYIDHNGDISTAEVAVDSYLISYTGYLYGINLTSGAVLWKGASPTCASSGAESPSFVAVPASDSTPAMIAYYCTTNGSTTITALDAATGSVLRKLDLNGTTYINGMWSVQQTLFLSVSSYSTEDCTFIFVPLSNGPTPTLTVQAPIPVQNYLGIDSDGSVYLGGVVGGLVQLGEC